MKASSPVSYSDRNENVALITKRFVDPRFVLDHAMMPKRGHDNGDPHFLSSSCVSSEARLAFSGARLMSRSTRQAKPRWSQDQSGRRQV
jgi:hypothetical protein